MADKSKGDKGREIKGQCKQKGCDARVQGKNGKEAGSAAMKHGKEAHGNSFLGFKW